MLLWKLTRQCCYLSVLVVVPISGLYSPGLAYGPTAEAKTKSYQLIVYLDGAFEPNNLHSFKIVVYNSDDKKLLSDNVTPDFSIHIKRLVLIMLLNNR